jgi:hypothetical protein
VARPDESRQSLAVLELADWLLTIVHSAVVLGFLLLWIPRRTARLHRWLVLLTAISWLGFGLLHGIGYCFLTDWQWRVKRTLGIAHLPPSFLHYAADRVTGTRVPRAWVDGVAAVVFAAGCIIAARPWLARLRSGSDHSSGH